MFRKIVSNLAFSPALVGQLGFYAKRLKKEEVTRRLGLVFTALALVVQSLTVFTPPESANAANGSDMIYGGISTKKQILAEYDKKRSDFKDIMDYAGITRAELANMTAGAINSKGKGTGEAAWQTWGRSHVFSPAQGEVKHVVPLDTGGSSTVYSKPLWLYDSTAYTIANGSSYPAFVGHSAKRGAFAIMKDCGNLVTTTTPKPYVGAHFIAASCETIRGKAIDGRDKNASVTVFLYFGGPPGKGDKSAPISTKVKDDNKFSIDVPQKYKKKAESTKVWGVMVPLAGWNDSTVQFNNPVTIPGGCIKQTPSANCDALSLKRISRTSVDLQARASAENGATIRSYSYSIVDSSGKVVASKSVSTAATSSSSGALSVTQPGAYTAKVSVSTSAGAKTGPSCTAAFTVTPEAAPAVAIEKTVDGVETKEVALNQEFTYEVTVTNTGDKELKNAVVSDPAPAGVTLVGAAVGSIKNNSWQHTIASLKIGESASFTIRATVKTYVAGAVKNTACVNAPEVNPGQPTASDDCDDAVVTVTPPTPPCANEDPTCVKVTESKTSQNLTQGVDASTIKAQASDRIEYTIYIENIGSVPTTRTISEDLSDVSEYATVTQNGGGNYDEASKVLSWSDVTLQPGEKTSRTFVVQVLEAIPSTARGESEPSSYDCIMTNAFGNTVDVDVACEAPKIVETTVQELPKTGPGENMLFAGLVGTIVTFFWARSRQLTGEVKLIRKDFNMGTI